MSVISEAIYEIIFQLHSCIYNEQLSRKMNQYIVPTSDQQQQWQCNDNLFGSESWHYSVLKTVHLAKR